MLEKDNYLEFEDESFEKLTDKGDTLYIKQRSTVTPVILWGKSYHELLAQDRFNILEEFKSKCISTANK